MPMFWATLVGLCVACGPPPPTDLETQVDPQPIAAPITTAPAFDPAYDLQEIQGTWETRWGGYVIRREIVGGKEQLAYYGADGKLDRSHTADIEVTRSVDGFTRRLRWSNLQSIVGPPATPATRAGEYRYDCDGSKLTEYHTVGAKTDTIVWTRIAGPPAPRSPEPYQ